MSTYPSMPYACWEQSRAPARPRAKPRAFPRLGRAAAMLSCALVRWQVRRLEQRIVALQPDRRLLVLFGAASSVR